MNRLNTFKFVATLANDINGLLEDAEEHNVSIEVGEKPDFKTFYAHSIILKARTPYFRTALSSNWARKEGNILIYSKPNIKPKIFEVILRFIYGGNVCMEILDAMEALDLLIASDELLLTELTEYVQNYLLENEFEWLEKNSIIVWENIYKYESCVKLQDYCIKLICKDPIKYLFTSAEFLNMDEKTLSEFLKLDGLQIEEIGLWNNILKWGLAQNPCLLLHNNNNDNNNSNNILLDDDDAGNNNNNNNNDDNSNVNNVNVMMTIATINTNNWAKKDFDLLANTLKNLIPLITISQISSTDFHNKIWPFRYILPDKMLEEIMTYHLDPTSPPLPVLQAKRFQFDSSLLRPNHIALISSWIDRLDQKRYTCEEMPYRLQLLLRGTQDGFDTETFHKKCDLIARTLVVMRNSKTGEIIGGYNPMMWTTSVDYKITEDSFLFSFGNRWRLEDARLSRVLHQRSFYAIRFNGKNYGPCFGDKDLCMKGCFNESGSCSAQKDDYCTSITDCKVFSVDEYEVFKIVNKKSQVYSFEFMEM